MNVARLNTLRWSLPLGAFVMLHPEPLSQEDFDDIQELLEIWKRGVQRRLDQDRDYLANEPYEKGGPHA